jgi:hypothetical protein
MSERSRRFLFGGAVIMTLIMLVPAQIVVSQFDDDVWTSPCLWASIILAVLYFIKLIDDDVFRPSRERKAREQEALQNELKG